MLLIAGVVALLGRKGQRQRGVFSTDEARHMVLLHLLVPIALLLTISLVRPTVYAERSFIIILLPSFAMLLAEGLLAFPRRQVRLALIVLALALNSLALYNLWIAKADRWTIHQPAPDWRAATAYLEHTRTPGEPIFSPSSLEVVAYYARQILPSDLHPNASLRAIEACVASSRQAMFFLTDEYLSGLFGREEVR